ncbi:MAG: DUF559 domain-containing protein, partial [Nitrospirae bacterium]|nr:DUF559 domain-containing protein [Nitrospirota bacterium]
SIDKDRDMPRDKWLNEQGYKVLRFWNNEVLQNIEMVLEVIRENCLSHPPLTPPIKGGVKGAIISINEGGKGSGEDKGHLPNLPT